MKQMGSTRRRRKPQSSGKVEFNTPRVVLDCIAQLGRIACDPCWNKRSKVKARIRYTERDNGLVQKWPRRGITYVNPPYGTALRRWVATIVQWGHNMREIVVLVPASTETAWFGVMRERCNACVCWKGRLTFDGCNTPAFFGSAVFYFGKRPHAFVHAFREHAYPIKCEAA
jgi:hypothetical protein